MNGEVAMMKYLEEQKNILAELGAFETGLLGVHWKVEDKLGEVELLYLSRLETGSFKEGVKSPPNHYVPAELTAQTIVSTMKNSYADMSTFSASYDDDQERRKIEVESDEEEEEAGLSLGGF
eukprot:snap_masked-scaffold_25-processed-gene-2.23-mRNA-1 protein AED:1.00 eAED:1.00 QI:0/0/0/0/1/1/2/0/121